MDGRRLDITRGIVYLVGAGPGDPKLLTIRGQELLRVADLVVYDRLVAPRLLKERSSKAKVIYVGKEADQHASSQAAINRLLIRAARCGKTVVRLKGGDPFLFGRGGEEALALAKANVAYEVVPGVTSAIAVPAYAGIPVTHRELSSSVAIVTGHEDPTKPGSAIRWEPLATACDTLVFLMGVSTLPGVVAQLRRHGRGARTPCAVIEWGTRPRQRTVAGSLSTIVRRVKQAAIRPPAIFVVGEVVSLRRRLNWFETKPLFGKRILVTRASEKAASLSGQLEALGAEVEELPAIELVPVKPNGLFRQALREIPKTDWVFFTSPEGIGWFARMLKPHRKDVRWLSGCHIGAIGPKTAAAIEEAGLHVDFVPRRFSQEGIVQELPRRVLDGKRALILSAEESRDVLQAGLRERGMQVTKVPIYRTVVPKRMRASMAALFNEPFDFITVTSASCVDHLFDALQALGPSTRPAAGGTRSVLRLRSGPSPERESRDSGFRPQGKPVGLHRQSPFARLRFASIGPVTSRAVRSHGGRVALEAKTSTIEGLVEALVRTRR